MKHLNKKYVLFLTLVMGMAFLNPQGHLLAENKELEEFDEHAAVMTGEIRDYFIQGNDYLRNGQYKLAIETFERLVEKNPHYAKVYDNLATAYYRIGQAQKAIFNFQKSIQLDPLSAVPYQGLGIVYGEMGQYQEALLSFQKAVEIDGNYVYAYQGLGTACFYLNKYAEAKENLQKAKDLFNRQGDYKSADEIGDLIKRIPR